MYMLSSLTLCDVVTNSGFSVSIHSNITAVYSSVLYTSANYSLICCGQEAIRSTMELTIPVNASKCIIGAPAAARFYLNASLIKFPSMKQEFIAVQAPKPCSFENFWQVVIEKKVY